jgi:hypothetical protein
MRRAVIIGALVSMLVLTAGASSRSRAGNTWTGTWSTNFNQMRLVQTGSTVEGRYDYDDGHLTGAVSGNVLKGRWDEAPTRKGQDAGPFEFTLSADSRSFTGTWRHEDNPTEPLGDWHGSCTSGACLQNGQATATGASRAAKAKAAVTWARGQLGSKAWAGKCQAFVERAYGAPPGTGFKTALAAANALDLHKTPITSAPPGALLFFDPSRNCPGARPRYGHTGISIGGGKMIDAERAVTVTDAGRRATWRKAFLGWAYPPATWPGRAK